MSTFIVYIQEEETTQDGALEEETTQDGALEEETTQDGAFEEETTQNDASEEETTPDNIEGNVPEVGEADAAKPDMLICTCTVLCHPADLEMEISEEINSDCPVCSALDADLGDCVGTEENLKLDRAAFADNGAIDTLGKLQAAIDSGMENIQLAGDINGNLKIGASKDKYTGNLTIDLANYTLSNSGEVIKYYGTEDSSLTLTGGGKVINTSSKYSKDDAYGALSVFEKGTVIIDNADVSSKGKYAIYMDKEFYTFSNLIIEEGTISIGSSSIWKSAAIYAPNDTVTIRGGVVSAEDEDATALWVAGEGGLTIEGGLIKNTGAGLALRVTIGTGSFSMSGGTVTSNANIGSNVFELSAENSIITDGMIECTGTGDAILIRSFAPGPIIEGGTIKASSGRAICLTGSAILTVNGGEITSGSGAYQDGMSTIRLERNNLSRTSLTVNGGTIENISSGPGHAISGNITGEIVISGGEIKTLNGTAIKSEMGGVNISGDPSISSLNGIGIENAENTVSITGGSPTVQGGVKAIDGVPKNLFQPVRILAGTSYDGAAAAIVGKAAFAANYNTYKYLHIDQNFVPVADIINVPTAGIAGTALPLNGTVKPADATSNAIEWSLGSGSTAPGAAVTDRAVFAAGTGIVVVNATVREGKDDGSDYIKEFIVNFVADPSDVSHVIYNLTNMTASGQPQQVPNGTPLEAILTAENGYWLPAAISVTMGGNILEPGNGYTYSSVSGALVIPKVTGVVEIIATGIKATIPVTGITLNKTSISLYSNAAPQTDTLTATITPGDATQKSVIWSSSNPNVVTVDANGKITAVSSGTAQITATTVDGGKTAVCTVTVQRASSGGGSSSGGGGGGGGGGSSSGGKGAVGGPSTGQSPYTDIANHWAKSDIDFVVSRGLFSGVSDTTFTPDSGTTRSAFATALGKLSGADVSGYKTSSFGDVKTEDNYMPYAEWAVSKNVIAGIGNGQFGPEQTVSREQMAVILFNYAKATGYNLPKTREAITFSDAAAINSAAKDAVIAMQTAGVIDGKNENKFDPTAAATRAEVSAALHRYAEIVVNPATAQGWDRNDSGFWIYYSDGRRATEWKQISDKWYYFYGDGTMAVNTQIGDYEVGADGAMK